MFRFPTPPNTLVTLQIECVSCKEQFALAEDQANENVSASWHMLSEQTAPIETPHLAPPFSQPLPHATPQNRAEPSNNQHEPVNCPRCGADNRNWVRLAYAEPPGSFWERQRLKLDKFSWIWIGYLVTACLLGKLIYREWHNEQLYAYIFVFIMLFLAGFLPIRSITSQWRGIREHKIENAYNTTRSNFQQISPGLIQGGIYLVIFVLVIPLFVYVFMPQIIDFFKTDSDLVTQIDEALIALDAQNLQTLQTADPKPFVQLDIALASLQKTLYDNMFLCNSNVITTMISNLENLKLQNPSPETIVMADNAIYTLRQLQMQANAGGCTPTQVADALYATGTIAPLQTTDTPADQITNTLQLTRLLIQENKDPELHAQVSSQVGLIKNVIDKANGVPSVPATATLLSTWLKYVGLACLVSVITAVVATNSYINKINPHLPQPLCHSLRNLTRVAIWEARHSLEINGNFHHIEWTEAAHNQHGGISLTGYLCPPTTGDSSEKQVRGTSYFIYSDMWGRVLTASSKPVRIPPSVQQAWENHEGKTETNLNHLFIPQHQTQ